MKTLILAAVSLGLAVSATAQIVPTADSAGGGLLGQTYAGVEYTYVNYHQGSPKSAHDYSFLFNQSLTTGLDLGVNYVHFLSLSTYGLKVRQNTLGLDLTGYIDQGWGKPFLQAGAGWTWVKGGGGSENSFTYFLGTGVEFPVGTAFAVAPFVCYQAAPDIAHAHEWNYGVKTSYRLSKDWSLSFTASINEHKDTSYGIGVNYHF